jgi:phospholipid transport system transporter-binding protein
MTSTPAMLRLPAELTHAQADACLAQWLSQLPMGTGPVVVDGSDLRQFDSTALALLLELRRHLLGRGQVLQLEAIPPRLGELATLYGVDELLAT